MAVPKKRTSKAGVKKRATPSRRVPAKKAGGYRGPREPRIPSGVTVVDEIPAPYQTNPRIFRFANRLAEIRRELQPGQSAVVAEFIGRGGATTVKNAIERGDRPIDGEIADWEFTARRSADGGSTLFATLVDRGNNQ